MVSWFASPIVTGCISASMFLLLRTLVLRRKNALLKSLFVLPFAVALTLFINIYFVFTKGAKKMLVSTSKDWSDAKVKKIGRRRRVSLSLRSLSLSFSFSLSWSLSFSLSSWKDRAREQ